MMQIPAMSEMSAMAPVATPSGQATQTSGQASYQYAGVVPSGTTYASPSVSYPQQATQPQQSAVSGSTGVYQSRYAPYSKK